MKLIRPSFKILNIQTETEAIKLIEKAGRTCYKSESKITPISAEYFIKKVLINKHESVLEHSLITVRIICDRGISHELVRHRLASFSQESTRYCNYKGGVTFIIPPWISLEEGIYNTDYFKTRSINPIASTWFHAMKYAKDSYLTLLGSGQSPQQARTVLPNSLKTEIVISANFREWRHIFNLRCAKNAHPQMREIMLPLQKELQRIMPVVFNN